MATCDPDTLMAEGASCWLCRSKSERESAIVQLLCKTAGEFPSLCMCMGVEADIELTISGGIAPFTGAVTGGHVPDGVAVGVSGNKITLSGPPATPGLYLVQVTVTDSMGSDKVIVIPLYVTTIGYSGLIDGAFTVPAVNSTVAAQLTTTDPVVVGDVLILGLISDGVRGLDMGTFEVTAASLPNVTLKNLTGTPAATVPDGAVAYWELSSLPDWEQDTPYSFQMPAVGGAGNYTWEVTGTLPVGLEMSLDGLISGTPTSGDNSVSLEFEVFDALCESGQASVPRPAARLSFRSQRTVATILGFEEFLTSTPPKKYKRRVYSTGMTGDDATGHPAIANEAMSCIFLASPTNTGFPTPDVSLNYITPSIADPIASGFDYQPLAAVIVTIQGEDAIDDTGKVLSSASITAFTSNIDSDVAVILTAGLSVGNFDMPGWSLKYNLANSFAGVPNPSYPTGVPYNWPLSVNTHYQVFRPGGGVPYPVPLSTPLTTTSTHQERITNGPGTPSYLEFLQWGLMGVYQQTSGLFFPPNLGLYVPGVDEGFPHFDSSLATFCCKHNYAIDLVDEYTDAIALANAHVVSSNSSTAVNHPRTTGYVSTFVTVDYDILLSNLVSGSSYIASVELVDQDFNTTIVNYPFVASGTTKTISDSVPTPTVGGTITVKSTRVVFDL